MDSLKMFKGYGKVEDNHHLEDQQQHQPSHPKFSKPLIATVSIFAILLLTLTLAALIHHTNTTESPQQPSISVTTPASIIKAVCNVTRYPDSCFSSITPLPPKISPIHKRFSTSPSMSLKEFTTLGYSLVLLNNGNGPALADCKDLIDDALSQLNDSLSAMSSGGKVLTDAKIGDIQTWVSAAATDQQTCFDGLDEMGSADAGEVKRLMQRSFEYISNSLAIIAHLHVLLDQFHVPRLSGEFITDLF